MENQENAAEKSDFVAAFVNEIEGGNGEKRNGDAPKMESVDDAINSIPLSDLMAMLPPDVINDLVSPSLWVAKKTLSKSFDQETAREVEKLFESRPEIIELKKNLWSQVLKRYFPNAGGKVDPLYALIGLEIFQTATAWREAKNFLAEKAHLWEKELKKGGEK